MVDCQSAAKELETSDQRSPMKIKILAGGNFLTPSLILRGYIVKMTMNMCRLKLLVCVIAACGLSLAARAQSTLYNYEFTLGAGVSLQDAFIIDTVPNASVAFTATNMSGTVFLGGASGSQVTGSVAIQDFTGSELTLIGVYSDGANIVNIDVAISLPNALASSFNSSSTWDDLNTSVNFPDELTTLDDLETGSIAPILSAFQYLSASSSVLLPAGNGNGTLVGFDGAEDLGSFTFQVVPEPSAMGLFAVGLGWLVLRLRKQH
jgi:PEP-CTERM motif